MQPPLSIFYFSDVLCEWAYAAQVKLDELQRAFGDQICVEYRFLPLFGDVTARIKTGWGDKGGAAGYSRHVQQMAERFNHIDIHREIWTRNVPPSSVSCHLFLKSIQLLERQGEVSAVSEQRFNGKSIFEETVWRCRLAFFRDLKDIADRKYQDAMASDLHLSRATYRKMIQNLFWATDYNIVAIPLVAGALFAPCAKARWIVKVSPTGSAQVIAGCSV